MGRVLTIRVSASTYDVRDVETRWPALCRLAWPRRERGDPPGGVLELVQALHDQVRFSDDMDEPAKEALGQGVQETARLAAALEEALADRDPQAADKLSYDIEDRLDGLEKTASKL
jgi:hypothetical protein